MFMQYCRKIRTKGRLSVKKCHFFGKSRAHFFKRRAYFSKNGLRKVLYIYTFLPNTRPAPVAPVAPIALRFAINIEQANTIPTLF